MVAVEQRHWERGSEMMTVGQRCSKNRIRTAVAGEYHHISGSDRYIVKMLLRRWHLLGKQMPSTRLHVIQICRSMIRVVTDYLIFV